MTTPTLPCTGKTALFFPAAPGGAPLPYGSTAYNHAVNQARIICVACPQRRACHARAVANGEQYGVWAAVDFGGKARDRRGGPLKRRKAG